MKFGRASVVFLLVASVLLIPTRLSGQTSQPEQKLNQQKRPQEPSGPQVVNTPFADFVAQAPYVHRTSASFPIFLAIKDSAREDLGDLPNVRIHGINVFLKRMNQSPAEFSKLNLPEGFVIKASAFGEPNEVSQQYNAIVTSDYTLDLRLQLLGIPIPGTWKEIEVDFVGWLMQIPLELIPRGESFDLKVDFDLLIESDVSLYLRSRIGDPLPALPNWYRGDTHYHSFYTDTKAEFGLPLDVTATVARQVGLDWVTVTDHSDSINDCKPVEQRNEWDQLLDDIKRINEAEPVKFIRGEEVSLRTIKPARSICGAVGLEFSKENIHLLAHPDPNRPYESIHILSDNTTVESEECIDGQRMDKTTLLVEEALRDYIAKAGGFAYAAHPLDEISCFIGGGVWQITGDIGVPTDFKDQDGNKREGLVGLEIWNLRNNLISGDTKDPYNISGSAEGFRPLQNNHFQRLTRGIEQGWKTLLKDGLYRFKTSGVLDKAFISAGSDSHGDFNYQSTADGDISLLLRDGVSYSLDSAFGKVVTIAWSNAGMGPRGENVLRALRDGHTVVSDGPILIFGIDRNGNESIDDNTDIHIGESFETSQAIIPLLVEWKSNSEFGEINQITIWRGTVDGESQLIFPLNEEERLWGKKQINVRGPTRDEGAIYYRMEIRTQLVIDPFTGLADQHHCFTNPIWMKFSAITQPEEVLSPVPGSLEVVSSLDQCSDTKWCFNQHKTGGHTVGGGIGQADDTYAGT